MRKEKSLSNREVSAKRKSSRFTRPNSAVGNKRYSTIKINNSNYNQVPPPIIFTMPNNKKMTSGMGNNIEREQLYENNMQLKESLNKLKRELAETKYNVVKKEIELREKEKIIRECIKENDSESAHESKMEKAKESALLTLCKEKYNALKNMYQKEIQDNKILRANIKITKIKEFQIENDVLNQELVKIKSLYENCKNNLKKYKGIVNDLNNIKDKFAEQHSIISSYAQKCNLLNAEIRNLKEERDNLLRELEINNKKREKLKLMNDKLKIKNTKFLNQKKLKEEYDFKNTDNEKNMIKLKKEVNELKRAFGQKIADYHELKKTCNTYQKKLDNVNETLLKPFKYKSIQFIEQEDNPKNIDKVELYKSLYDESKMKNVIYEKYFKEKNINPTDIIKEYGYYGVLNTDNRLLLLDKNKDKDKDKDKDKNSSYSNSKISKKDEVIKHLDKEDNIKNNSKDIKNKEDNEVSIKKEKEKEIINDKININNSNNSNNNNNNNNLDDKNLNIHNDNINNNIIKEEDEEKHEEIKHIDAVNDDVKTKFSEDTNTNTNTYTKANTVNNNYNTNNNTNNNNINDEDDKIVEINTDENENENENNFLALIHLFLKNFEANHITMEILENKMKKIFELFEGKSESSKEEFLQPFINLFIESMKVTQESDKLIVQTFFNEYIEFLKGNTNDFFNEIVIIFENLVDYTPIENNENLLNSLSLKLKKYKNELQKKLKENDKDGNNLITFDIFRKIINELNITLEDELIEFLLYKMKSSVPENHSIFDLNYKIIIDLLNKEQLENIEEDEKNKESEDEKENDDLSKKISDKLSEFKNNMLKDNTDLENACKDKVQTFNNDDNHYEVIEKDDFFEIMEKYEVVCDEEIKETIYRLFINEDPICTNSGTFMMMDFLKLKNLFLNNYYNE